MSEQELTGESITAEGLEDLRAEVEELEGTGRQKMAARIKVARELGDLKENADYHIAKEDQAHLETRIKRLRRRLANAVVVEVDAKAETFAFGRTAEVLDESTGDVHTWTLVGATEADFSQGRLSAESPVGRALRDLPVGKKVKIETPRGEKAYVVKKLI
jgi:transcription elongation factor GreA